MSLETDGGSSEVADTGSAETSPAADVSTPSSSGYSVTDPGIEIGPEVDDGVDVLAALRAENGLDPDTKRKKPSETLDDASDTDGEAEETETAPTDDAADSDGISDELLDRAATLGYTVAEIKGFTDAKAFEKEVSRVERIQERLQQRQGEKKDPPVTDPAPEEDPEPDWDAMIEEGHDPSTIELNKKTWQRAHAAETLVKQMVSAEKQREWNAQCERFDTTLNNLGEEYKALFGEGRRGDLLKASPEAAANRDRVFQQMQILRTGYQAAGIPVPAEAQLINEAVQSSFHKQTQEIARKAITSQIKKSSKQALSRPHSTGAKPLSGEPKALAMERDFWKQRS